MFACWCSCAAQIDATNSIATESFIQKLRDSLVVEKILGLSKLAVVPISL